MKTLIVEDHSAMVEGYKSILKLIDNNINFKFTTAKNCEQAINAIERDEFELVLLDINVPPMKERNIHSGVDIAMIIRQKMSNCKILILTSHIEKLKLYSIIKDLSPDGLMVKSDFSPEDFLNAIKRIIDGETVFTPLVYDSVKEVNRETFYLDSTNRQILQLLSDGIRTKNLPTYLDISQSAINKRKVQIKDYLGIFKGTDEEMIKEARRAGLI